MARKSPVCSLSPTRDIAPIITKSSNVASRANDEDDDPVTAEYDVYLTPALQEQLLLLQYPNRAADRPYNDPSPESMRLKPKSGHIEVDIPLQTNGNFNKYQALKWGSSLQPDSHSNSSTYGIAAGLNSHFIPNGSAYGRRRGSINDEVDRDLQLSNDLASYDEAESEGKALRAQTLGGQIIHHDGSGDSSGKPLYFVGVFKGSELHLSQIAGTAQLRPVFHHLDAEDVRERISTREAAIAEAGPSSRPEPRPRIVHQSYKSGPAGGTGNPKGELEEQSANLTMALRTAAEEQWMELKYVDEYEDLAFETYGKRLFNADAGTDRCRVLKAGMDAEAWLDAMSAPGRRGTGRRRGEKGAGEDDEGDLEDGG